MLANLIQTTTQAGEPIQAGDTQIIPMARVVRVQLPGLPGGLIWNRPVAVVTLDQAGQQTVHSIRDITRIAQFALLGVGLIGAALIWFASREVPSG